MFGLCSLSSARSKSVLLVEENFVFYCGHSVLRYVPFAGPAGPTFSFLPFPSFSQRFLSEWKQCWFSPAWGSPLPLSLPTNGSHASNRAGNSSCWCRSPTRLSKPHTALHGPSLVFLPRTRLPLPLKGEGRGITHLSWVGRVGSVRSKLGHAGSTGPTLFLAGAGPLPGLQNRTQGHTGSSLGFTVFFLFSFSMAILPATAPGGSLRLRILAKSCRAASRFLRPRPMSIRWWAGFR